MGEIKKIQTVAVDKLIPYINNAKKHSDDQVTRLASSIREFGFVNPILIDKEFNVIAGHGRLMAAKRLNMSEVPCLFVEGLSEAQRKAYILADNKLAELAAWDMETVIGQFEELKEMEFDLSLTGFDFPELNDREEWFSREDKEYGERQEGNDEYNEFLDKFEIAKTTDDCYTPQNIYDAVAEWVAKEYKLEQQTFFRPFYPGGDYQKENYKGKIVVDNPPFSILSEIEEWYNSKGIKYFLFAPAMTIFPSGRKCSAICVCVGVTYENGAKVPTSFVTNLENCVARSAPDLYQIVKNVDTENTKGKEVPTYEYPANVVTASMIGYFSKYGAEFKLEDKDTSEKISALDSQKEAGKGLYGGGFLISEKAAAEKAAAEKAAAEKAAAEKAAALVWELSDREKEIIKSLGKK